MSQQYNLIKNSKKHNFLPVKKSSPAQRLSVRTIEDFEGEKEQVTAFQYSENLRMI